MLLEPLTAVSSVDGRYRATAAALAGYFSEYALIKKRLIVECAYLRLLSSARDVGMKRTFTEQELELLRALADISIEDAATVKRIEREGYEGIPATNHDVKALEYFIKTKLAKTSLKDVSEWTHFALTSEDINSIAHAIALRGALQAVILPALEEIRNGLATSAVAHASIAMLARTHGQPASPTTFGKEMRVFESRLKRQMEQLRA